MIPRYKLKQKDDTCLLCNRPIGSGVSNFSKELSDVITNCGFERVPEKFLELCYQCAIRCLSWKDTNILSHNHDSIGDINPENGPLTESNLILFIADQLEVLSKRILDDKLPYRCHAYCGKYGEQHICPNYAAHIVHDHPLCDQHKNIYFKRGLLKIYKGKWEDSKSVQLAKILLKGK